MKFSNILIAVALASTATALPVEAGMDSYSSGIANSVIAMVKRVTSSSATATAAQEEVLPQIFVMST